MFEYNSVLKTYIAFLRDCRVCKDSNDWECTISEICFPEPETGLLGVLDEPELFRLKTRFTLLLKLFELKCAGLIGFGGLTNLIEFFGFNFELFTIFSLDSIFKNKQTKYTINRNYSNGWTHFSLSLLLR